MSAGSPSSRVSPNVTLSSNLISPYGPSLNGYRMSAQQQGYGAASFNPGQLQITNMANVMNMQPQYQDPTALQRAAVQQYSTYPYMLNANIRR